MQRKTWYLTGKCLSERKNRNEQARAKYQSAVEKSNTASDTVYVSADVQEVNMLPQMEQFESAAFTRRIVAFIQSFVPTGPGPTKMKPMAATWQEAISGIYT